VPVWHELLKERVARGELRVIGLTQEQHADRCALYAQWRGFDFPILWDPFNLTRSAAVPMVMGVDANGVLRAQLSARRAEASLDEFLGMLWPAQVLEPADPYPSLDLASSRADTYPRDPNSAAQYGLAKVLFHRVNHGAGPTRAVFEDALSKVGGYAAMEGSPAEARFRLGVLYRLRYDTPHRESADFQASLDAWMGALLENPNQYVWRRRIQQWGPRLDKPYPFYDWVEQAMLEVRARGQQPVVLEVPLTGSEVAGRSNEIPLREREDTHPDPEAKLTRDSGKLVGLDHAAALHTGIASKRVREPAGTARVHLVLRLNRASDVRWGNEAGPTQVWVEVPEGWNVRRNLWTLPVPDGEVSSTEVRGLDFEVRPPGITGPPDDDAKGPPPPAPVVRGTAFYYVCEGQSGVCRYVAQDFEVPIPVPAMSREEDH
jgi:hypothetical protein